MSFLAPMMFWGALAAGIPIALHFFYRSRYRVVPWAAMEFLLTSIQQTSRRLKFQELLLLILRCVLLALLAVALARPAFNLFGGSGRGEAIDAVLLFDTSYSMAAREAGNSRLDLAKTAARQVLDNLPASSTVQIVACADRAALLGPRSPGNLDQARQLIDELKPTELATEFLPGATEALKALERGHAPNREVYLFSDMQKLGWEQQSSALRKRFEEIHQKAQVYMVRCGTQPIRNAAIVGLVGQLGIPHVGERTTMAVLVRNTGKVPLHDLTVTLEVDGRSQDKDSQTIALLSANETKPVPLTVKLLRPGQQVVTATVGPDDLDSDNRFEQVIQVREQVRVLVVDGHPSEREPDKSGSFHLLSALLPVPENKRSEYHIQPRVTVPRQASPVLLADKELCILVDVPLKPGLANEGGQLSAEFVERLASFVREGHGLLIFSGPHMEPDAYNQIFYDQYGLLPLKLGKPYVVPADHRLNPDVGSTNPYSFLAPFRDGPLSGLGLTDVFSAMDTEIPTGADEKSGATRIELSYTNGKPALASRRVGRGEVLLCTTTSDPRWTDWAARIPYPPLIHTTLGHLLQSSVITQNRTAGQPLTWYPSADEETLSHILTPPVGDDVDLGRPKIDNGLPAYTILDTARAGLYRLKPTAGSAERITRLDPDAKIDTAGALFAVNPDLRESENLEALQNKEIDEQLGFSAIHLTAGTDTTSVGAERLSREWTAWLLAVVLGLVLCETALAWFCAKAW